MNRRRFMHYVQAGLITSLGTGLATHWQSSSAQAAGSLSIRWLGHTCFLFSGSGIQVLVNPFRPAGCTAKYPSPQTSANIVLISSRLLDEGVVEGLPGRPKLLFEPGLIKPTVCSSKVYGRSMIGSTAIGLAPMWLGSGFKGG